jgi:hypothetical protein
LWEEDMLWERAPLPHQAMPPGKSRGEGGLGPMSERELAARKARDEVVAQVEEGLRVDRLPS